VTFFTAIFTLSYIYSCSGVCWLLSTRRWWLLENICLIEAKIVVSQQLLTGSEREI